MISLLFLKAGADPELGFARQDRRGRWTLVPAFEILGSKSLKSFIGTDGHAATGELRPPPSRNINTLLVNVASALELITRTIGNRVSLVASPMHGNDPLGGHIHLSFLTDNSAVRTAIYDYGLPLWSDHGENRLETLRGHLANRPDVLALVENPTAPFPWNFAKALSFLGGPLEYWVQPITRRDRTAYYGKPLDVRGTVRAHPSPKISHLQYEYRAPCTWLAHPRLAYVYLAVAKLGLLNYSKCLSMAPDPLVLFKEANGLHQDLLAYYDLFIERLSALGPLRRTRDLSFLETNIRWLKDHRAEMWDRPSIWVDEWAQLVLSPIEVPEAHYEDLADDPPRGNPNPAAPEELDGLELEGPIPEGPEEEENP